MSYRRLDLSHARYVLLFALSLPTACSTASSGSGETVDSAVVIEGPTDGASPSMTTCEAELAALHVLAPDLTTCTAVLHVDGSDTSILGYQILCDPASESSPRSAAAQLQLDTGFPKAGCGRGLEIDVNSSEDFRSVYFLPPTAGASGGCDDGWFSVGFTSPTTGLTATLAGGTISNAPGGGLVYPTSWRPVEEIGIGCDYWFTPNPSASVPTWDMTQPLTSEGRGSQFSPGELTPLDTLVSGSALFGMYGGAHAYPQIWALKYESQPGVSRPEFFIFLSEGI